MLSSEDIKNAERWAKDYGNTMTNGGMMSHSMFVEYLKNAVIFGMEYQLTRQRYRIVEIDRQAMEASKLDGPSFLEQVGERCWKIKDGHE